MTAEAKRPPALRSTVRRLIVVMSAGVLLISVLTGATVIRLTNQRSELINQLDPAVEEVRNLQASVVEQETGVHGYALSRELSFLEPYQRGRTEQVRASRQLTSLLTNYPERLADVEAVGQAMTDWRTFAAEPIIAAAAEGDPLSQDLLQAGRSHFNSARDAIRELALGVEASRLRISEQLTNAFTLFVATLVATLGALIFSIVSLYRGTRRQVLEPLERLRADARRVASGELSHRVQPSGPLEMTDLAGDVNAMRARILEELEELEGLHRDLEEKAAEMDRSNRDLEQFAYVASHDLQEPLRKVASFCQLLQKRYAGRLDERADEYIEYAVDGAQRMQQLINDLLRFSRVGLSPDAVRSVDCNRIVDGAISSLQDPISETGAKVERDHLPVVRGDPGLLSLVFENLISNGIKFRSEETPAIGITSRDAGEYWDFGVSDNGIGIPPHQAERIFVIFQRLHARDEYPGTGIGLALVKRIVESHGGRVWLDTPKSSGTTVRFTLPKDEKNDDPSDHPTYPDSADRGRSR